MLTAYEREKLIAQWNHDQLVAEWRRQRSAAYAGAIQRAVRAVVAMIKRPLSRAGGSAAPRSPDVAAT